MMAVQHKRADKRSSASAARARPHAVQSVVANTTLQRTPSCACGGTCPRCQAKRAQLHAMDFSHGDHADARADNASERSSPSGEFVALPIQRKLAMGRSDDPAEAEADRIADQVMRMAEPGPIGSTPSRVSRKCEACEKEDESAKLQTKRDGGGALNGSEAPPIVHEVLRSPGQPLDADARAFMEPRFGRGFDKVRIHTGSSASVAARSINALAFTAGNDVVVGDSNYASGTHVGRQLLAHELTHVVQQEEGAAPAAVRRQTIDASCTAAQSGLNSAWAKGQQLTKDTIDSLEIAHQSLGYGATPPWAQAIQNAFGSVGLTPGDLTFLPELIRRYQQILGGFQSGKTLRCDPNAAGTGRDECDWRDAFVVVGNSTDIFLCPLFFEPDKSVTSRGLTLLHEMAHSVLRATHAGIPERTYPSAFFDCSTPLGVEWDDAKKNAFAYELLANCLHGERPSTIVTSRPEATNPPIGGSAEARWSLSGALGADVTPDMQRFAGALGGRVSLRTGEFVIFNPVIGLNLLYLPSSSTSPSSLAAATADLGLRIQQPLQGFYFDISAGGFAGFDIDPEHDPSAQFTGGPTGAVGLGWRWQRLDLGAETRALVPQADLDRTQILVFGRAALRFR